MQTRSRARPLPIGRLSKTTGVNIETIRYYERVGLLPAPPRSAGQRPRACFEVRPLLISRAAD
jgi:MerR family mercuric resistance operon transcriptional regulator